MQPLQLIRQIPTHVSHALTWGIATASGTKRGVADYWAAKRVELYGLWQSHGEPFYKRNIKPLEKIDYLLIGASFSLAGVIIVVTAKFFPALVPVSVLIGALLFLKACLSHHDRVRQQHEEMAWDYLDQIRRAVHSTTKTHHNFALIEGYQTHLPPADFEDLKKDISELEEKIRAFKKVVCSPSYEEKQHLLIDHLAPLELLVQGHPADKAIIHALKTQVNKAKEDQSVDALHNKKRTLDGLQTPQIHPHIAEVKNKIEALIKAARRPTLVDSKQALIASLGGVQNKLVWHRHVEALPIANVAEENGGDPEGGEAVEITPSVPDVAGDNQGEREEAEGEVVV